MEDGEVSETEVPAPNLAQNQVEELEEGELAESEVHCAEVADAGEALPDSASTASSPPRQRSAENQRLPHFGSASMCDEETDAERDGLEVAAAEDVQVPDFDGWHGWTVVATTEGRLFFFHEGMQLSQWHQPPELDPILGVWTEARDETQLTRPRFWRNDLLKISLWRDPRETSNIYQAAMDGNIFFLQLFSQVSGELDCVDHRGCSALHYAAAGGSAPSALFLLQRSAMVDRTDITLTTPLMLTCRYGFPVVLKVLLDAQANPNLADNDGQVPLHQAAELGQLDCLNLLLLCGAQAQQRNVHGETALAIAQRHRHMHCVTLLRRHRHSALDGRQHEGACASPRGLAPSFPGAPLPRKVAELQQKKAWNPNCSMQHFPGEIVQNSDAAAPWDLPYQEAGAGSFVEYPSRYSSPGMPEADTSGSEEEDNSPSFSSRSRSRQQWQQRESGEDGLFSRLRRRLFPIRADLGMPNQYRFNMATQQWELPPEWEAYLQPG
ncbi:CASKIN1 [Symbiodinium sp. CCMP2456]|nr:CASKIN1 [Symbiodinium sp. CCMP2456]